MAEQEGMYENIPDTVITLTEINDKVTRNYPIIVRVVSKEYKFPYDRDLQPDVELLLEKSKGLQFVLVRILSFYDENQARREKGDEFVVERNDYVGKEFLIPICYPGKIKLINKPGRHSRYASIAEAIHHLPRFIRLNQETVYTPPRNSHATTSLAAGTTLEIRSVYTPTAEITRYAKCTSTKTSKTYEFRDDCPIHCTAIDDPTEYTLLKLATSVLLPKNIEFERVWVEDVVLKDDEEARAMLTLTGGPIRVLKVVRRDVFIAWMKPGGKSRKTVAVIPTEGWCNQMVQIQSHANELEKREYINTHFGQSLDSRFVTDGLYSMRPVEDGVVWLDVPQIPNKQNTLADYVNVYEDDEDDDYEQIGPAKPNVRENPVLDEYETTENTLADYVNVYEDDEQIGPAKPNVRASNHLETDMVQLPTSNKQKKQDVLQRILEKTKLGFDKVHLQLLKRKNENESKAAQQKAKPHPHVMHSESNSTRKVKETNTDIDEQLRHQLTEDNKQLCRVYLKHTEPILSTKPDLPTGNISNKTDKDKLYVYGQANDQDGIFFRNFSVIEPQEKKTVNTKTMPNSPDRNKIDGPDQSSDDFYSYTIKELVECLNMCGLKKFAIECNTNTIDGEFFRKFDLNELKNEPFSLNNIELLKVKKVIEQGWRPH